MVYLTSGGARAAVLAMRGVSVIINNVVEGQLFLPGQPEELAENIPRLMEDSLLRIRTICAAARGKSSSNRDMETWAVEWKTPYQKFLQSRDSKS